MCLGPAEAGQNTGASKTSLAPSTEADAHVATPETMIPETMIPETTIPETTVRVTANGAVEERVGFIHRRGTLLASKTQAAVTATITADGRETQPASLPAFLQKEDQCLHRATVPNRSFDIVCNKRVAWEFRQSGTADCRSDKSFS